jgi:hypothetical protein
VPYIWHLTLLYNTAAISAARQNNLPGTLTTRKVTREEKTHVFQMVYASDASSCTNYKAASFASAATFGALCGVSASMVAQLGRACSGRGPGMTALPAAM